MSRFPSLDALVEKWREFGKEAQQLQARLYADQLAKALEALPDAERDPLTLKLQELANGLDNERSVVVGVYRRDSVSAELCREAADALTAARQEIETLKNQVQELETELIVSRPTAAEKQLAQLTEPLAALHQAIAEYRHNPYMLYLVLKAVPILVAESN